MRLGGRKGALPERHLRLGSVLLQAQRAQHFAPWTLSLPDECERQMLRSIDELVRPVLGIILALGRANDGAPGSTRPQVHFERRNGEILRSPPFHRVCALGAQVPHRFSRGVKDAGNHQLTLGEVVGLFLRVPSHVTFLSMNAPPGGRSCADACAKSLPGEQMHGGCHSRREAEPFSLGRAQHAGRSRMRMSVE